MAINKNHTFDDLAGIKCCIVEENANSERVDYLKKILEFNKYTVVVVPSPPPKTAAAPASTTGTAPVAEGEAPIPPSTFTIGVTDLSFNTVNAIWGRLLLNPDGTVVTQKQWLGN